MSWRVEHDVLIVGALRIAVQRIGIGHWQPSARLRSWGAAPLHREADAILAPCDQGEALWLGAWLEDAGARAQVRLHDPASGAGASIVLPPDGQLTALDSAPDTPQALTIVASGAGDPSRQRTLRLTLDVTNETHAIALVLMPPAAWAARAGRDVPEPLAGAPPLPPRLG